MCSASGVSQCSHLALVVALRNLEWSKHYIIRPLQTWAVSLASASLLIGSTMMRPINVKMVIGGESVVILEEGGFRENPVLDIVLAVNANNMTVRH